MYAMPRGRPPVAVRPVEAEGRAPVVHDPDDVRRDAEGGEGAVEVLAVLDESVPSRPGVVELLGVAHADEVEGDAARQRCHARHDVAPEIGRGRVAVQEDDGVAPARLDVGHALAEHLDRPLRRRVWSHGQIVAAGGGRPKTVVPPRPGSPHAGPACRIPSAADRTGDRRTCRPQKTRLDKRRSAFPCLTRSISDAPPRDAAERGIVLRPDPRRAVHPPRRPSEQREPGCPGKCGGGQPAPTLVEMPRLQD